jgi:DNA-directed RNA polymerase specialized sigma24 family protein
LSPTSYSNSVKNIVTRASRNYYRDRPGREIAHRTGLPLGTVRSRLYYALKTLSQRLEELGYER